MVAIILCLFRFIRLLGSGRQGVAVENLALRLQLAAFRRKRKRPILTQLDRLFWAALSQVWSGWRGALLFVQPDTVVRWQRERFRRFWARLSQPKRGRKGRPTIATEVRQLVLQMAIANPLWRAPRIHGELKMLGITISERTVSRILQSVPSPPSQRWKTFLHNHVGQLVSIDFFTVPTLTMKVLFVFIVLEHRRREVLHFNVTEHPPGTGPPDRSSRPSPIGMHRAISYEIAMASMEMKFGCGSRRCILKKYSLHPGVPGRIRTPDA